MRGTLGAALLVAMFAVPAVAQDGPVLTIGDRVPTIDIGHFFQGEPVKSFDPNKIYVLEFWATW